MAEPQVAGVRVSTSAARLAAEHRVGGGVRGCGVWHWHDAVANTLSARHSSAGHRRSCDVSRFVIYVSCRFAAIPVPDHQAANRAKNWLMQIV